MSKQNCTNAQTHTRPVHWLLLAFANELDGQLEDATHACGLEKTLRKVELEVEHAVQFTFVVDEPTQVAQFDNTELQPAHRIKHIENETKNNTCILVHFPFALFAKKPAGQFEAVTHDEPSK